MNNELINNLINQYLLALESSNIQAILQLFTPDALVYSSLYGKTTPQAFYPKLFADTNCSKTVLKEVLVGELKVAAYFEYEWTLSNRKTVKFDCVDIFDLTEAKNQFKALKIIYDTYLVREPFNVLQHQEETRYQEFAAKIDMAIEQMNQGQYLEGKAFEAEMDCF